MIEPYQATDEWVKDELLTTLGAVDNALVTVSKATEPGATLLLARATCLSGLATIVTAEGG